MRRVTHVMVGSEPIVGDEGGGPMTMTDDEMLRLLVRLDERTERLEKDVAQLRHAVCEGNGSPALTVTVARLDERTTALEESAKERTTISAAKLGVISALGAAALTGLFELVKLIA